MGRACRRRRHPRRRPLPCGREVRTAPSEVRLSRFAMPPVSQAAWPARSALVVILLLGVAALDLRAGECWPGFRGQDRQGVGASAEAPLRWSANEHVRWKTPIPGRGHSSPVVSGDLVFVTTAYESSRDRQLLGYARGLRVTLCMLVLASAVLLPRTKTWWQDALAAAALAAFVLLGVTDEQLFQFGRSAARRWLGAALTVQVGLIVSAYGLPSASRLRHIVALAVAAVGVGALVGVPDGLHQTRAIAAAVLGIVAAAAASAVLLARGLFAGAAPGKVTGIRFGAPAWVLTAWRGAVLAGAALGFVTATVLAPRSGWAYAVAAVDRDSGAVRWIREGLTAPRATVHRANSPATPTAVIDDARIVAYFGTPGLMAVSPSGRLLWTNRNLPFQSMYGVGASPVLAAGAVLVSSFTRAGPYLAAVDAATGRERWRTARADVHPEFGDSRTPLLMTIQGRPTVIVWGIHELAGHDAATGRLLWHYAHGANQRMGSMVTSILGDGDRLFLPLENGMIA